MSGSGGLVQNAGFGAFLLIFLKCQTYQVFWISDPLGRSEKIRHATQAAGGLNASLNCSGADRACQGLSLKIENMSANNNVCLEVHLGYFGYFVKSRSKYCFLLLSMNTHGGLTPPAEDLQRCQLFWTDSQRRRCLLALLEVLLQGSSRQKPRYRGVQHQSVDLLSHTQGGLLPGL